MGPLGSIISKIKAAAIDAVPDLAFGAKGPMVSALQQKLADLGERVKVDGDWGNETDAAVRSFQAKNDLKVDGIVGEQTLTKLLALGGTGAGEKPEAKFDLTKELASADSELCVAIGMAEGTRSANGGRTEAYNEHRDPAKAKMNQGTFSYQHGARNAQEADQKQLQELRRFRPQYEEACRKAGIDPGNKLVAAACFDLYNQAPKAATGKGGLLDQLPALAKKGLTEENLAKARKDSFFDPDLGKFDTTFPRIKALADDQTRRMAALADKVQGGEPAVATARAHTPVPIHQRPQEIEKFRHEYETACGKAGIDPGNKLVKAACFDFYDKAPVAATAKGGLLDRLPEVAKNGVTVENLAKARTESFLNPDTGKYETEFASIKGLRDEQTRQVAELAGKIQRDELTAAPGRTHTPVPEGKIGFGSQGPEVLQLKKDLKAAGFYDGVLNDKMGNDGIAALEKAKTQLGIGGPKDVAGPETLKAIADAGKWPTLHVPVDFLSQINGGTPRANSSDCDDVCQQMMEQTNNVANRVTPCHGNANVIECSGDNPKGTKLASDYLFGQLKADKPVMIGVDYKAGTGTSNVNDIDHYLVVTGSGVDKQGRQYLTFNDPQQPNARLGTDANPANRLYKVGGEFKQLDVQMGQTPYELRGVVRNQ